MRLLPFLIILAALNASAQNTVRLLQYTDVEACEGDGKGNITVGVDIGTILPEDNFQGYEIAVSYKDQPLKGMMPVLTANSLTSQIPSQYVAFGNDGENEEIYGSAFLITSGNTGLSGSRPLVGFRIQDNSECFQAADLKITQFYVNEECTIDFDIDSTLTIVKDYDESLITELEVSSTIRDSILNIDREQTSVDYKVSGSFIDQSVDSLSITFSEYSSFENEIIVYGEYQTMNEIENTIVLVDYKFPSDGLIVQREIINTAGFDKNDTIELNASFQVKTICDCLRLDDVTNNTVYIEKNPLSANQVELVDNSVKISYNNGLIIENYKGVLNVVNVRGKMASYNYSNHPIIFEPGMYIINIPGVKTEKLIINNF
jgi:hypothetical protein